MAKSLAKKPAVGRPKDAAKREDIVRAAASIFMKDGYSNASMEAIAKKADVSKLTIYSHFADKDALFRQVMNHRCDIMAMPESFMALAPLTPEEGMMQIGAKMMDILYRPDTIRLQRLIQAEAVRHPKVVTMFYESGPKRVREAFGALLAEWNRRNELHVPDLAVATQQFFSLLKGEMLMKTMMYLATPPNADEKAQHIKNTVSFFLAAYIPKTKTVQKGSL